VLPAHIIFLSSGPAQKQEKAKAPARADGATSKAERDPFPLKPFLTHYRGGMMVMTCVAILAVDFPIFPRRFAKVENWGTSFMDVGVGSFVFSSGTVSARGMLKDRLAGKSTSLLRRLAASIRHSIPLLVLGLIRLYSVKGLDYAEHVTEYGVHWNFFFTLGLLPPFVALFQSLLSLIPSYAIISFLMASVYEIVLDNTGLKAFILTAPRDNLLSQNREGIFSFIGYLAIFLAGQATGTYVLPREEPMSKTPTKMEALKKSTLGRLLMWCGIWTTLFLISTSYYGFGLSVSRRMANLPYFLWISAMNTGLILGLCAAEVFCFPNLYSAVDKAVEKERCQNATSKIYKAYNRNGLAVFLVANLLTGLVNLTVRTLDAGRGESMAILIGYISAVTAVALGLDWLDVSIKL
jgi:glucosaminylphosphatidylinositol acyltransferase